MFVLTVLLSQMTRLDCLSKVPGVKVLLIEAKSKFFYTTG